MPHSQTAASILRDARTVAGLSQRELAVRAGTAQSVVGRIEAGTVSPTIETLTRLLAAADCELELRLQPSSRRDPMVEAYKAGVDQSLLIENLRKTPRERIENLMAMQRFTAQVRRAGEESRQRVAEPPGGYKIDHRRE
jgi:transcriptional regulator with XRE-family HTH domain